MNWHESNLANEREMMSDIVRSSERSGVGRCHGLPSIANKRPGDCHLCGQLVAVGGGLAVKCRDGWKVEHRPARWQGSPVSGQMVGGCPPVTSCAVRSAS